MKNIVSASVLVFLILFISSVIFLRWSSEHLYVYAVGPNGYRVVDVDTTIPLDSQFNTNDATALHQSVYTYTIHVAKTRTIIVDVDNIVLNLTDQSIDDHYGFVNTDTRITNIEKSDCDTYQIYTIQVLINVYEPHDEAVYLLLQQIHSIKYSLSIDVKR